MRGFLKGLWGPTWSENQARERQRIRNDEFDRRHQRGKYAPKPPPAPPLTRKGRRVLAVIVTLTVAIIVASVVFAKPSSTAQPTTSTSASPFWPVGTTADEMCAADGGVMTGGIYPTGGAAPGQLPPGSQVSCTDGAIQTIQP